MANLITRLRIVFSIALLAFPAFSPAFYVCYLAAGLTDVLDGAVARKMKTASAFGAKLDTVADVVFVAACMIRLLPAADVPVWLGVWIAVIALIKLVNVISGFVCQKQFVAVHSVANKATGILLFALPLTMPFAALRYTAPAVCALATFAAVQEGHRIRKNTARTDPVT